MTALKIRIKTGEHEFEAEGAPDAVQSGLSAFLLLLGRGEKTDEKPAPPPSPPDITKIFGVKGKVVSMKAKSQSLPQDILVVLLGQQQLRGNAAVAGTEIMAGLRASGHKISRADLILKRHASVGDIVVTGKRRNRRYRLTTDGAQKALIVARALAASTTTKPREDEKVDNAR